MPSGCAKRRTTSKISLNPLGGLAAAAVFAGLRIVGFLFGVTGRFSVDPIGRGRAKCPQEYRGQPRVFFERAGATIARLRLGRAEDLVQCGAADHFPNLFEIFGERYLAAVRGFGWGHRSGGAYIRDGRFPSTMPYRGRWSAGPFPSRLARMR